MVRHLILPARSGCLMMYGHYLASTHALSRSEIAQDGLGVLSIRTLFQWLALQARHNKSWAGCQVGQPLLRCRDGAIASVNPRAYYQQTASSENLFASHVFPVLFIILCLCRKVTSSCMSQLVLCPTHTRQNWAISVLSGHQDHPT